MKILEVLDSFYPSVDGPINVIINIAKILKEKNLADVELLVPYYPKKVEIEGIKIHRCASVGGGPEGYRVVTPTIDSKVKNLIKYGGFDIIHAHSPFGLGKYAISCGKKCNIPTIMTVHTKYKSDFERILKSKSLQNFMVSFIMRGVNSADYVLSVSEGAAKTVWEYGYKGKNIHIIRNGTDLKFADLNPEVQQQIEKKYHLRGNFVFLFVGRIVENKNIQFSLEVLRKLKLMGLRKFKFLIVGSGEYIKTLKQIIKEYNLSSNVVFAGKIMDRDLLSQIYRRADLFMFPSTFDTCGIVAIEAAANKLPSAMLENTCASEKIVGGENGMCFPEDTTIWANEIYKLTKNPKLLKSMGEEAYKSVYVKWDEIVLEYYDYYQEVLKDYALKPKKNVKKVSQKKASQIAKKKKIERAKNIKKIRKPILKAEQKAKEEHKKEIVKRAIKIKNAKKSQEKLAKNLKKQQKIDENKQKSKIKNDKNKQNIKQQKQKTKATKSEQKNKKQKN